MIARDTIRFFLFFFRAYPGRSALVVVLLAFAGLAEGLSVTTLIPVLELAEGGADSPSGLGQYVVRALGAVGLDATLFNLLGLIVFVMTLKAGHLWLAMR
jgi:ATP-binding cassette subfamily C protein